MMCQSETKWFGKRQPYFLFSFWLSCDVLFVEYLPTQKTVWLHSECTCGFYILSLLKYSDLDALIWFMYLGLLMAIEYFMSLHNLFSRFPLLLLCIWVVLVLVCIKLLLLCMYLYILSFSPLELFSYSIVPKVELPGQRVL